MKSPLLKRDCQQRYSTTLCLFRRHTINIKSVTIDGGTRPQQSQKRRWGRHPWAIRISDWVWDRNSADDSRIVERDKSQSSEQIFRIFLVESLYGQSSSSVIRAFSCRVGPNPRTQILRSTIPAVFCIWTVHGGNKNLVEDLYMTFEWSLSRNHHDAWDIQTSSQCQDLPFQILVIVWEIIYPKLGIFPASRSNYLCRFSRWPRLSSSPNIEHTLEWLEKAIRLSASDTRASCLQRSKSTHGSRIPPSFPYSGKVMRFVWMILIARSAFRWSTTQEILISLAPAPSQRHKVMIE